MRPLIVVIPINGWNRVTEQTLRFGVQISGNVSALHVTPEKDNEACAIYGWNTSSFSAKTLEKKN